MVAIVRFKETAIGGVVTSRLQRAIGRVFRTVIIPPARVTTTVISNWITPFTIIDIRLSLLLWHWNGRRNYPIVVDLLPIEISFLNILNILKFSFSGFVCVVNRIGLW